MIQGKTVENGNLALHKNAERKKTVLGQNAENSYSSIFTVVYIKTKQNKKHK